MKSKVHESFVTAAKLVLDEIGFSNINVIDNGANLASVGDEKDMMAMVGLVGALKGHIVLHFESGNATAFVEHLSGHLGMTDTPPDDPSYRKAALGEMANQIGGRAIALLAEEDIDCMITPPTVISGMHLDAALPESEDRSAFAVSGNFGKFSCILAIKNSKVI